MRARSYGACFESRSSSWPIPAGLGAPGEGSGRVWGFRAKPRQWRWQASSGVRRRRGEAVMGGLAARETLGV